MKAGDYAEFEGSTYRAKVRYGAERVGIYVFGGRPPGPEFSRVHDQSPWSRAVPRRDCDRLYRVETWALYREVYPVYLDQWLEEDAVVANFLQGPGFPDEFNGITPRAALLGDELPPGFQLVEPGGRVAGAVTLGELTEPRSTVFELPLDPEPPVEHRPPKRRPKRGKRPPWADKA